MAYELIKESKIIVDKINSISEKDEGFINTDYGHAARNLAWGVPGIASELNPEQQKEHLRGSALELVKMFGPKIIPLLREELRNVLTEEEIAKYQK